MREVTGDLWAGSIWRVVTTNLATNARSEAVMGRGVARQAADQFPLLPLLYGSALKAGHRGLWKHGPYGIICFPVKRHWKDQADLGMIEQSCRELRQFAAVRELATIYMPWPGIGFGGRSASEVCPILERHLGDVDNVILVSRGADVQDRYASTFRAGAQVDKS